VTRSEGETTGTGSEYCDRNQRFPHCGIYNDVWVVTCGATLRSYSLRWISRSVDAVMHIEISVAAQNNARRILQAYVSQLRSLDE
jgi:hypothetical protein